MAAKTVGKYELYKTLGEGAFGKVKYAVNKENGEAVAIKILGRYTLPASLELTNWHFFCAT
jgi:serine/threonine protein kinase